MGIFEKHNLIYFLGIGGCGMSAIAKILQARGFKVSGSDIKENTYTIRLREEGIKINIGHYADNVRLANVVVVSTAVPPDNVELLAAKKLNIPIIKRAQALNDLMKEQETRIAVSGTHGKTTTSGLIATMLKEAQLQPTYLIGGDISGYNKNADAGQGRFFVAEADESDGSILELEPTILIITNIEEDHLEHLGSLDNIKKIFWQVIQSLPDDGILIINYDNPACQELWQKTKVEKPHLQIKTYGHDKNADWYLQNMVVNGYESQADVFCAGKKEGTINLKIPGEHNLENALAAVAVGQMLGLTFAAVCEALYLFTGMKRRFQLIGTEGGISIIDDYAHHPSEIKATLAAAKAGFQSRIICVFQPHRYSRTQTLSGEFANSFADADVAIITDVYSAGERPINGISGKTIFGKIKQGATAYYIPKKEDACLKALELLKAGDIFLTMGAGDIYTIAKEALLRLRHKKHQQELDAVATTMEISA